MTYLLLLLSISFHSYGESTVSARKALVYKGRGGCESCAHAAGKAARGAGYTVEYVGSAELSEKSFKNVKLWVQPAGNAISAAEALGTEGLNLIREFVKNGGSYVGFCSGAFLADSIVDDEGKVQGLGLLPVGTADYEVNDKSNIDMVWINWGTQRRHVFFNGGATFLINKKSEDKKLSSLTVLATYVSDGLPAAIFTKFGKGKVAVSGAHPEAPNKWKNRAIQDDEDGDDLDLAVEMINLTKN